jgi:hypothetical protein
MITTNVQKQSAFRLWTRRVANATCVVVVMSMVACDRGDSDVRSATDKDRTAPPVSTKPSDEGVRPALPPEEPDSGPAEAKLLVGRWVRTDTPYVIEIRTARDDGTLEAAYYNPSPINVARAEARQKQGGLEVFVELRDVNYPGATYTLTFDRATDRLSGVYFQPALQQSFQVACAREQAEH